MQNPLARKGVESLAAGIARCAGERLRFLAFSDVAALAAT